MNDEWMNEIDKRLELYVHVVDATIIITHRYDSRRMEHLASPVGASDRHIPLSSESLPVKS